MNDAVSPSEFLAASGTAEWRVVGDGACSFFRTDSYAASVRFVDAIGQLPGVGAHPPKVDIRHNGVTIRLLTTDDGSYGLSRRDVTLAGQISAAARAMGMAGDPEVVQSVVVIPGALSVPEVMPFWQAMLGYERRPDSPDEDLVDPHDRGPAFWFEAMDEPRADGGGAVHIAVWVPHEQAQARIAAALAAGGRLVRDEFAPRWWTLADAAGNECDIATIKGRG